MLTPRVVKGDWRTLYLSRDEDPQGPLEFVLMLRGYTDPRAAVEDLESTSRLVRERLGEPVRTQADGDPMSDTDLLVSHRRVWETERVEVVVELVRYGEQAEIKVQETWHLLTNGVYGAGLV